MKNKILAAVILSTAFFTAACHTVKGAGQDVQSAGKAVEKAAK